MNICTCEKYKNNIGYLDNTVVSAWIHGQNYLGEVFEYCPWCGKKMIKEDLDHAKNPYLEFFSQLILIFFPIF